MWLFSKDASSTFGYTCSSEPRCKNVELDGWTLYDCKNKKGDEYTMLVFELINRSPAEISAAQNYLKRLKTLRHPNMLTYVDSCESTRCVQIVTEWVEPLHTYLREKSDRGGNFMFMTSWGLYQVTKALIFLHDDCRLLHNHVRLSSIFVTRSGEWKLGGHSFISTKEEKALMSQKGNAGQPGDPYMPPDGELVDSWGLGCLLWEVYHGQSRLSAVQDLRDTQPLPPSLLRPYQGLVHPKIAARTSVSAFFKASMTPGTGFFANFYVETLLFLEEVQLRSAEEKKEFFQELGERVESFPDAIAKYKILPHLMNAFQYGGAGIEVLLPLLKLSKLLEQKEFEQNVVPCLVKMFSSQDRATRVKLLEHLPSFVDHLPEKVVSEQIFPSVSTGFADTHPMVREATIRAMLPLAPKLTEKILNDSLFKQIMVLQVKDEQGGIRANSTVCLAKLAPHFTDATRQGPMLNGFLKCLRDPFCPARQAAASAILTTLGYYGGRELACKVMPCVALLTIDAEKEVRGIALRVCRAVLTRLEEASENPELLSKTQSADQGKAAASEMGWTNWAVSALSSKLLTRSAKPDSSSPASANSGQATPTHERSETKVVATRHDDDDDGTSSKVPATASAPSKPRPDRRAMRTGTKDDNTEKANKKAPLKLGTKVNKANPAPELEDWSSGGGWEESSLNEPSMDTFGGGTGGGAGGGGWNNAWDEDLHPDTVNSHKPAKNSLASHEKHDSPFLQPVDVVSDHQQPDTNDWNTDAFLNDFMQPTSKVGGKRVPVTKSTSRTTDPHTSLGSTERKPAVMKKEVSPVKKAGAEDNWGDW